MPILLVIIAILFALCGCATTVPEEALRLPPQSLADRQIQTRRFDGISEAELLSACAGVLQDLGFNLDEAESNLGLLVVSKQRTAHEPTKATMAKLLDILVDIEIEVDKEQQIRASLVTQPVAGTTDSYHVRVTFQRIVWNTENSISKRQVLNEPELHQRFFDKLSKSVFLEANSI